MTQYWQFTPVDRIEESTFHPVLERFYKNGISGLIRENIQNSLDGKLKEIEGPVTVTIKTGTIDKEHIPGLDEVKERILSLQGRNGYTKETIAHMQNKLHTQTIQYISFEDSNTKGLRGAKNGQTNSNEDTWSIYAYNKGVHTIEADESAEQARGGSHGIGKIASNAASDLYLMYFANCDEFGNQHLGGTIQLIEHEMNSKCYRATGYFTQIQDGKFYPFENHYHEVFQKQTRGLKIIVPFLRSEFSDEIEIIKAVCDSFFLSILEGKLQVYINDKCLNIQTIGQYMANQIYYPDHVEPKNLNFTPYYYQTYTELEPQRITIKDKKETYEFNLYFRYDLSIPKGRIGIIRTIGMKIEDKKISGHVNKPFNGILIPVSSKEDAYLKSLENESHTQLAFDHIKDPKLQSNAKRFINNITKEISQVIEVAIKQNNPTDGKIDTGDILYVVETQFKQELSKVASPVKLKKGSKEQTVVKVKTDVPKKKPKNKEAKEQDQKPPLKRKPRAKDEDEGKIKYQAQPDRVQRAIIGNAEILRFDFSKSPEIKNVKTCDVSLAVVDGMGKEYPNELKLRDAYTQITDLTTSKSLKVEGDIIRNVVLTKGVAQLKLQSSDNNLNKNLKFVYYVEV
ncbi:hypothetical protein PNU17_09885 [Turicibacter sanguinis]|uniref:hypothetical protein n=2 Tax=Turicibacter sanguinis TaxID=154288 RepID=UPI001045AEEE|nr:hypothetical protein [Turicibacter sanguinis]MCU7192747.1 hypothetical protein [Turicibacter sanguinis]MCU7212362.1 hypothetical protein [Turicibacter sanguinis]MDB8544134.1 hypothetical protein [Turicibacter sanguinis]MDB8556080.1 hypothetical protein [Turicibacter sanguinis]MDB8564150.1 hypothetical protein [Turicibacter sanguinis]